MKNRASSYAHKSEVRDTKSGPYRTRTDHLFYAIEALYQMS